MTHENTKRQNSILILANYIDSHSELLIWQVTNDSHFLYKNFIGSFSFGGNYDTMTKNLILIYISRILAPVWAGLAESAPRHLGPTEAKMKTMRTFEEEKNTY